MLDGVSGIGRPFPAGCWTKLAVLDGLLGGLSGPDLAEVSGIGRASPGRMLDKVSGLLGGLSGPDLAEVNCIGRNLRAGRGRS